MAEPSSPIEVVNLSGYPLQIALAREIESRRGVHGWRVLYREHAWKHPADGCEGFIDLVLQHDATNIVLVVECKRLQDKDWIFLPEDGDAQLRRYSRSYCVARPEASAQVAKGWIDTAGDPRSPQAAFCATARDSREKTLDNVAAEIVSAAEALSYEETAAYLSGRRGKFRRLYCPVIVTTARLSVCSFDPLDISLAEGKLPPATLHESFGVVRYTKQLSTQPVRLAPGQEIGSEADTLGRVKARTAFIVLADRFDSFLCDFQIDGQWPNFP